MKKITLIGFIIGMTVALDSFASDGKVYNSASCFVKKGEGTYALANMENQSSDKTLVAKCFGIKDRINHDIKFGWIEVIDQSEDEDVSCTLKSRYNNIGESGGGVWQDTRSTSGSSKNWKKLDFGGLEAKSNGHYFISCHVPKKTNDGVSSLGAYLIEEKS